MMFNFQTVGTLTRTDITGHTKLFQRLLLLQLADDVRQLVSG